MFLAASSRCFSDLSFGEACQLLAEQEFDKVEIWIDESSDHLKPAEVADNPDRFAAICRENSRITPIAFCLAHDVDKTVFEGLCKAAQLMRITQITVPSSPLGTPFNEEIDRLKSLVSIATKYAVRLSIKTQTERLTEDPHTAIELCQSAKGLGLTFDPSYYLAGPRKDIPYDLVMPYVFHVHLRDTTPESLQVAVGLGEIDYSRLINHLERESYDRALSVEMLPELMDVNERPLELRKIRRLLETLL